MNVELVRRRIAADLEQLSRFTSTPGKGCTRLPFSPETRAAAEYLKKAMLAARMEVHEDAAGNVFGRLAGKNRELPCVMMGSHYDSVYNGGNYDGIAGVVAAIELARIMQEENFLPSCDYVAAAFMDEEGCRFGNGYFGSRCMLGNFDARELDLLDKDEISLRKAIEDYGLSPQALPNAAWPAGSIGKYIELHIEQGPVLDSEKIEIGLVESIVGIERYSIQIRGRADHAGTTPMYMRKDAVSMAAKVICDVTSCAAGYEHGTVATAGRITAEPGAVNIVAQSAEFTFDIRSVKADILSAVSDCLKTSLQETTARCGADFTCDCTLRVSPLSMSKPMLSSMEQSCAARGFTCRRLPSGAGHDALEIGRFVESVMVFTPSLNGRSHCPEEYTEDTNFAKACAVVFDLIKTL